MGLKFPAKYGPQYDRDDPLKRKYRMLQSWYRVEVLKLTPDQYKDVGSQMADAYGKGLNFLSEEAYRYAEERSRIFRLNIDRRRLFTNLLSSQPMCFNLFSDLRAGIAKKNPAAISLIKYMFIELRIKTVAWMEVELRPELIKKYIGDGTAFDAAIHFRGQTGKSSLLAIETKYTEGLGDNTAKREEKKWKLVHRLKILNEAGLEHYQKRGFDQVIRNFLLAQAYADKHSLRVYSFTLGPAEDVETIQEIDRLKDMLNGPFKDSVKFIPLEEIVRRALAVAMGDYKALLENFNRRYLDLSPVKDWL